MLDNSREIADFIERNNSFLILSHYNPDGDAFGSSFAMLYILRKNGKRADFYMPSNVNKKYAKLIDSSMMLNGDLPDLSVYSAIFCLDFSTPQRACLPEGKKLEQFGKFIINIDHHPDNKIFGNLNIVRTRASACSEIIYDFAKFAKLPVDKVSAEFLLMGILSDTGCFRFENTSPQALKAASELIEIGADFSAIANNLFLSKTIETARLEGEIVCKYLKTAFNGKFLWAVLDEQLFSKFGLLLSESEGMIDAIKCIEGAVAVAFLYHNNDGFRCSLRSKDKKFSVGEIARRLGGGGHEMAAGAFIRTNIVAEAERIILNEIKNALDNYEKK